MQDIEVFTPLNEARTERLNFAMTEVEVLDGDLDQRGLGPKATVKIAGNQYVVVGTHCSLGRCNCDAYIKEIDVDPDETRLDQPGSR